MSLINFLRTIWSLVLNRAGATTTNVHFAIVLYKTGASYVKFISHTNCPWNHTKQHLIEPQTTISPHPHPVNPNSLFNHTQIRMNLNIPPNQIREGKGGGEINLCFPNFSIVDLGGLDHWCHWSRTRTMFGYLFVSLP